ncbi:RDD family protein [Aestuariimicrobium soli]|uniref:RDD family protein n=1 Tax=Aestuariimicrobium soli TaxID=2035834 RepID=UPI003EB9EAB4
MNETAGANPDAQRPSTGPGASLPPMGWYPDPTDPAQERYWEGTRWTHNVRDPQPDERWSAGLGRPAAPVGDAQAQTPQQSAAGQSPHAVGRAQGPGHPTRGQNSLALIRPVTDDGVPLASFGQRLLARLLDGIAVSAIAIPLAWPWVRRYVDIVSAEASKGVIPNQLELAEKIQGPVAAIALIWVAVMFAYQLLMVGLTSRTLGKLALGLRIVPVGRGHQRIGWGSALLRALTVGGTALVDISIGVATLIACLWSLQKPRCQALQDRFARTQVVSTS